MSPLSVNALAACYSKHNKKVNKNKKNNVFVFVSLLPLFFFKPFFSQNRNCTKRAQKKTKNKKRKKKAITNVFNIIGDMRGIHF